MTLWTMDSCMESFDWKCLWCAIQFEFTIILEYQPKHFKLDSFVVCELKMSICRLNFKFRHFNINWWRPNLSIDGAHELNFWNSPTVLLFPRKINLFLGKSNRNYLILLNQAYKDHLLQWQNSSRWKSFMI